MKRPEKYPRKMMKLIIRELLKNIPLKDIEDVYQDRVVTEEINSTLKKFGITDTSYEEFGFWSKLVMDNYNSLDSGELKIPKRQRYNVYIDIDVRKYTTETYVQRVFSYYEDKEHIEDMLRNDSDFDYYAGDLVDDNIYDSDVTDWNISVIELGKLQESSKKENSLLENSELKTKEIKELQKMKMLIEERLKILGF